MNTTICVTRKILRNRWAQGFVALVLISGVVFLVWGGLGLSALFGGLGGLLLPFLLTGGRNPVITGEDELPRSKPNYGWKWDGSVDDGGDPYGNDMF